MAVNDKSELIHDISTPHTLQSEAGFLTYLDMRPWRELIIQRSWDDFRAQSLKTYLGAFWWVIDPLITMAIYYLVFGIFFGRADGDYVPFLLTGIVVYHYFLNVVGNGCTSIYNAKGLIRHVGIPKLVFPLSSILVQTYQLAFSVALLFLIVLFYGMAMSFYVIAFPIVMFVVLLIAAGAAMILASITPFVPDISRFSSYLLRIGYFVCGIQYSVSELSEDVQIYLLMNPLTHLVNAARDCLMYDRWPDWGILGVCALGGIAGILAGAAIIWRFDLIYARDMEE